MIHDNLYVKICISRRYIPSWEERNVQGSETVHRLHAVGALPARRDAMDAAAGTGGSWNRGAAAAYETDDLPPLRPADPGPDRSGLCLS